jgi:hypothetical protein
MLLDLQKPEDWVYCKRNDDIYYSMRFPNCAFEKEQEFAICRWFANHGIKYKETNLWWSVAIISHMKPDITSKGTVEFQISESAYFKLFKDEDPDEYDDMSEMCDLGF